jgi:hypothetical protein
MHSRSPLCRGRGLHPLRGLALQVNSPPATAASRRMRPTADARRAMAPLHPDLTVAVCVESHARDRRPGEPALFDGRSEQSLETPSVSPSARTPCIPAGRTEMPTAPPVELLRPEASASRRLRSYSMLAVTSRPSGGRENRAGLPHARNVGLAVRRDQRRQPLETACDGASSATPTDAGLARPEAAPESCQGSPPGLRASAPDTRRGRVVTRRSLVAQDGRVHQRLPHLRDTAS